MMSASKKGNDDEAGTKEEAAAVVQVEQGYKMQECA